jgi:hypothetical protein
MFTDGERAEIRAEVLNDLVAIEREISSHAGSFDTLVLLNGAPVFSHGAHGLPVIRRIV